MTHSSLTNQIRLSNQSDSRRGTGVDTVLIHHQAGTNDDATIEAMVNETKEVSANYTISNEGRITLVVDEDFRAFTSGSLYDGGKGAAWDRRAITIEIENQTAGPDWLISLAAKTAMAKLLADIRKRYRIVYVYGHRQLYELYGASYPTFCPGPNTVAEILAIEATLGTNSSEDDMPDRGEILRNFRTTTDGKNRTPDLYFRSPTRGIIHIRNGYELGLLERNVVLDGAKGEVMFPAEIAMINYYLVAPSAQSTVVDTSFLTKTVQDSLAAIGKSLKVDVSLTPDEVAKISKVVNDEFAKRIAS